MPIKTMPIKMIVLSLVVLIAIAGAVAAVPLGGGSGEEHCVVSISPVQPGKQGSVVAKPQCYSTSSEAWAAANGSMHNGIGQMSSHTVIGADYGHAHYGGTSYLWAADNAVGCNTGFSYQAASMPSGWNDTISSAKTFGGCSTNTHYQDDNFGGSTHVCQCSTMGVMNDETSSERWAP